MKKKCNECNEEKPLSEFHKHAASKDGLQTTCKSCRIEKSLKYYFDNQKEISDKRKTPEWKYFSYQTSAKRRNYEFELSKEEFISLYTAPCHYCGEQIANGVDRINNKIGYKFPNCVPCCEICNKMKLTLDYTSFMIHIKKISKNIGTKYEGK